MNRKSIKIFVIFILFLFTILISNKNYAAETYFKANPNIPSAGKGFLVKNTETELTKINIDSDNKKLIITTIDTSYNVKNTKKIDYELSLIGNVYSGKTYNFIVFGDINSEESNSKEVVRVVKYSKTWQRLDSCSYFGINTVQPFYAGTCDITELNGNLLINTCHLMYKSSDGNNHQANMYFQIKISDMSNVYARTGISNFGTGYVSHSFDQYIKNDGTYAYTVDHGDAYPRGIAVGRYSLDVNNRYRFLNGDNIYTAPGEIGDNYTGYTISAQELSANNILIAGTSIDMSLGLNSNNSRKNLYLLVVPKNNITEENTKKIWFTNYKEGNNTYISCIHLTKVNDNKFLLMWKESSETQYGSFKMVIIDGSGNKLTSIINVGGNITENISPVLFNNKIVWTYSNTTTDTIVFYLDISSTTKFNSYKNLNIINSNYFSHFTTSFSEYYNELQILKYDDSSENVTIPYPNLPYIKIVLNSNVFSECKKVKNVTISEGFEVLGYSAFYNCSSIKKVTIPASCKKIDDYCFSYCANLKEITFKGNNIKSIGRMAFAGVGISDLKLPDSIESIGELAFYYSNIENIKLPVNLKILEKHVFSHCSKLKKLTLPSKLELIKENALYGLTSVSGELVIPKSVKEIESGAMAYSNGYSKIKFENPKILLGKKAFEIEKEMFVGESKKYFEGINFSNVVANKTECVELSKNGTIKALKEGYVSIEYYKDGIKEPCANISIRITKPEQSKNETDSVLPFKDVKKSDWFYNAVNYTYVNKIISGYNSTTFAPNDKLTRGMMVTILYRMEGSPSNNGKSKFSDVSSKEWYSKAIKWASDNGIVNGYGGTTKFGPNDNIIRQDLAGILRNYAKYKKKNTNITANLTKFKDYKKVEAYANSSMNWAVGSGVITGNSDGTLNPKGNATRAEAAAMIQKYCNNVGR